MAQLAAVLILGVSSFLSGWMLRRIQAKGREAQLQRFLTEANTSIPLLETSVRNRDQRIASLFGELTEWKARVPTLEATTKRHEAETLAKERELRAARVEIDALKLTVAAAPDPAKRHELDVVRNALRDAQARCTELTAAIAERDARLAAPIPSFIALPVAPATESEAALHARVERLEVSLTARDAQIAELQTRLAGETQAARSLQTELDGRTAEIDRAHAEGAKWRARVPKLVATIKARDTALADRDAAVAERDATLATRDTTLAERETMLVARDAELAAQAATLLQGEARVADLSSQLAAMSQQLEAAAGHHAAKLATALRLGREELDGHHATLERVQAESAARSTRAKALEAEVAALQNQLREATETAAADAQSHTTAEAALRTRTAEIEQTVVRSQQLARDQQSVHEQQLARAAEQYAQLERQLAQAHQHRAQIERRRSELDEQLAASSKAQAALEHEAAALRTESEATEQRMQQAQRDANERVAQDTEQQTIELVELRDEVRTLHTRVAPLESLLKQRDSALFERGERIEAMTLQIQALVAQTESLQATLRQRGEKIATLERKFSDQPPAPPATSESTDRRGDHLEQRLVAQIERNRELAKIVEERDRDIAAAAKSNELNGKSMLILKQQLDDARQTEARLAGQVRELKAESQRAPEADATPAAQPISKPNGLFELPPEHVDELQQIRGIGDGFERGLNKLGVFQFSQLAGLSASEIAWIEAHLPTFHGRIDRDDWPGQAAALMAASEHAEWSLRAQNAPSMSPRVN
jgi:predicted flap endonuclease-1-like 5' DNA nuclease/chromosome segregation ATPase